MRLGVAARSRHAGTSGAGAPAAGAAVGVTGVGVSGTGASGAEAGGAEAGGSPFGGPHLLVRAAPFAVVALLAEVSLVLPGGTGSVPAVVISLVLLAATAAAFLLPWGRLPGWASVLVPLCYTGSVLALILAAGPTSGVGIVVLIPLVWTALFHRRWESACVIVAIVAVEITVSLVPQAAPASVVVRRVLLWASLGALVSIATHGLRDRIRRSQRERAQLESRVRELTVLADRDRIASDLQDLVIKRLFAAGMSLQAAVSMATKGSVASRIESAIRDLDEAMRLIRHSIFGLSGHDRGTGLRQGILDLCGELAAAGGRTPEVTFSGRIDSAIPAGTGEQLVEMLREALAVIGDWARPTRVGVAADDGVRVTVDGAGPARGPAALTGAAATTPGSAPAPGSSARTSTSRRFPAVPGSPGTCR